MTAVAVVVRDLTGGELLSPGLKGEIACHGCEFLADFHKEVAL